MASAKIYHNDKLVDLFEFDSYLYIADDSGFESNPILYWNTEKRQQWRTVNINQVKNSWMFPRQICLIKGKAPNPSLFRLRFLRTDWQIQLNGTFCNPGFYKDICLYWQSVNLYYDKYVISLEFPEYGNETAERIYPLPIAEQDTTE